LITDNNIVLDRVDIKNTGLVRHCPEKYYPEKYCPKKYCSERTGKNLYRNLRKGAD